MIITVAPEHKFQFYNNIDSLAADVLIKKNFDICIVDRFCNNFKNIDFLIIS